MTTLSGSKILVIGASSGVGRATAVSLVALGAKVVAAARRRERLDELRTATAGALETRTLDATDGERKSPASTRNGLRPAAASCCFSVATRARPPSPSIGAMV